MDLADDGESREAVPWPPDPAVQRLTVSCHDVPGSPSETDGARGGRLLQDLGLLELPSSPGTSPSQDPLSDE